MKYVREHTDQRGTYRQPWQGRELPPPPQVNELSANQRRDLFHMGATTLYHPPQKQLERLQLIFDRVWYLFPERITNPNQPTITALYAYDSEKCEGSFQTAGGMCCFWLNENRLGGVAMIGIDRAYLTNSIDDDQLAFIVLHEVAHACYCPEYEGHTPEYHAGLDLMISAYNRIYDSGVENDYLQYNEESEFRDIP